MSAGATLRPLFLERAKRPVMHRQGHFSGRNRSKSTVKEIVRRKKNTPQGTHKRPSTHINASFLAVQPSESQKHSARNVPSSFAHHPDACNSSLVLKKTPNFATPLCQAQTFLFVGAACNCRSDFEHCFGLCVPPQLLRTITSFSRRTVNQASCCVDHRGYIACDCSHEPPKGYRFCTPVLRCCAHLPQLLCFFLWTERSTVAQHFHI